MQEWLARKNSRVVDQDVNRAEFFLRTRDGSVNRGAVADVDGDGQRPRA